MSARATGILLHSIPYLGSHRIVKIIAPDEGLITLMAKQVSKKNLTGVTTPFVLAEWVYTKGKKEIHLLNEAFLLDPFDELKKEYNRLQAAAQMAQDILRTQMGEKKAKDAFELLIACFRKLPIFTEPAVLGSVFRLRLLQSEGMIHFTESCSECDSPMSHLFGGESFCSRHAPGGSLDFTVQERQLLKLMSLSRSFSELSLVPFNQRLKKKIDDLFEERVR